MWWTQVQINLPTLVASGYQIVGFSAVPESNRIMDVRAFRYVLQKGVSVLTCIEKIPTTGEQPLIANCYALVSAQPLTAPEDPPWLKQ